MDFDLIYLGNSSNNKGDLIKDNIYNLDINNSCWGCYGILINNEYEISQ
jgi:hypothetical protein